MSDKRCHRGPHPEDPESFGIAALPALRDAAHDFHWLLDRGYAHRSGIKLVGDRYALRERQRTAVQRAACSATERDSRAAREWPLSDIAGRCLQIDGYNLLTTTEAALAHGLVLVGRDRTVRDLASIHGHFKFVVETGPALEIIGRNLQRLSPAEVVWYLDRPVSNSGRLATLLRETAATHAWPWRVELVPNPDPVLAASSEIIVSADSMILDRCTAWTNLAAEVIRSSVPDAWIVDFATNSFG